MKHFEMRIVIPLNAICSAIRVFSRVKRHALATTSPLMASALSSW